MSDHVLYHEDPDAAITLARNEYVFFGADLQQLAEKYEIPQDVLGEFAFTGKGCWRELRAKVEEDNLDGLLNTNLYILKQTLNAAIAKAHEFLQKKDLVIEDWADAEKLMKIVREMTKTAQVTSQLKAERLPGKGKRIEERTAVPGLPFDDEDDEDEEDEYSKPSPQKEAAERKHLDEQELLHELSLDTLI